MQLLGKWLEILEKHYKCIKVHIYKEQMSKFDNYRKENHTYIHVGLGVVR